MSRYRAFGIIGTVSASFIYADKPLYNEYEIEIIDKPLNLYRHEILESGIRSGREWVNHNLSSINTKLQGITDDIVKLEQSTSKEYASYFKSEEQRNLFNGIISTLGATLTGLFLVRRRSFIFRYTVPFVFGYGAVSFFFPNLTGGVNHGLLEKVEALETRSKFLEGLLHERKAKVEEVMEKLDLKEEVVKELKNVSDKTVPDTESVTGSITELDSEKEEKTEAQN